MNDNFMPDMPEREVDAYPYPNEDVRAYFAARGRQPTNPREFRFGLPAGSRRLTSRLF